MAFRFSCFERSLLRLLSSLCAACERGHQERREEMEMRGREGSARAQ